MKEQQLPGVPVMGTRIRTAKAADEDTLAGLHFRAYANRFFDEKAANRNGVVYGAPLRKEFPVLAEGQNEIYFRQYWKGFMRGLAAPDPRARNYCFIAESRCAAPEPVAFVKGSGSPVSEDSSIAATFNAAARSDPSLVPASQCAELGSVYCDPDSKYRGYGRRLVATYARVMLGLGYRGMITRAYDKNDSVDFFEKLGARRMGKCDIPNDYLDSQGKPATMTIPGVWLYWGQEALKKFAADGGQRAPGYKIG